MIGRRTKRKEESESTEPRGFDDYDLRLGDMMRGERATLGKSLLDVERELRIRASYVAAIENADPDAFDTPGFIPGYVRSYGRYLGIDPDAAFRAFCTESGFTTAHGMSAEASSVHKPDLPARRGPQDDDPLVAPATPFLPESESFLSRIEPGAIGSALVLIALIGAIGYGGWTVLTEVQRVQFAPVENTPDVLSDLDPLETAGAAPSEDAAITAAAASGVFRPPRGDAGRFDRLYRPQALDVPVMVARDAPISTLDPAQMGTLRPEPPQADRGIDQAVAAANAFDTEPAPSPQVVETPPPDVRIVAVRPAWLRVRAADGSVIYEGILNAGESYNVPETEEPATLRAGESGAVYFAIGGKHYGPVGKSGSVTSDLALSAETLTAAYGLADLNRDQDLSRYVAQLDAGDAPQD